ncbi:uncharacterized protein LOC124431440 isoform X1 [Vespa crabro]|uniref:uncharacterized protein LOC124431440 isoform X1 n=1 Tax=Vespa crabro TaxID=7445 RepID=UPI001EFFB149|nr:uncharacterized protein LOC124431440 isoform X1 [Vespa crabro]XP_046835328.1 uncharacterized protein LOC124431440 isoform X1 [Vespa crabro]
MTESPTPSTSKCHDDKSDKSEKVVFLQIQDINCQVAQFRDLLINVGQPRDCPELREKIRKLRRSCVEACKGTSQLVLPQVRSAMDVGIPADSPNLVLLFFVTQLFLRELSKSKNLIRIVPMDMTGYFESRAGPSNIGNVISQILLCKQITPDFNEEELCSIKKDSEEIGALIAELQEFMPQSEADTEKCVALQEAGNRVTRNNGGRKVNRWNTSNRSRQSSYCRCGFKFLCCTARTNYI